MPASPISNFSQKIADSTLLTTAHYHSPPSALLDLLHNPPRLLTLSEFVKDLTEVQPNQYVFREDIPLAFGLTNSLNVNVVYECRPDGINTNVKAKLAWAPWEFLSTRLRFELRLEDVGGETLVKETAKVEGALWGTWWLALEQAREAHREMFIRIAEELSKSNRKDWGMGL